MNLEIRTRAGEFILVRYQNEKFKKKSNRTQCKTQKPLISNKSKEDFIEDFKQLVEDITKIIDKHIYDSNRIKCRIKLIFNSVNLSVKNYIYNENWLDDEFWNIFKENDAFEDVINGLYNNIYIYSLDIYFDIIYGIINEYFQETGIGIDIIHDINEHFQETGIGISIDIYNDDFKNFITSSIDCIIKEEYGSESIDGYNELEYSIDKFKRKRKINGELTNDKNNLNVYIEYLKDPENELSVNAMETNYNGFVNAISIAERLLIENTSNSKIDEGLDED